jgi:preprotein translocase subunit SecD
VCFFAFPNFLPEKIVKSWPVWAQRHIVLGLDLQGGSHVLFQVDTDAVRKDRVEALREDVRRVVRENRFGSPAAVTIRGNSVEFRVREGVDQASVLSKLRELSQPLGGILSATGQRNIEVVDASGGLIRLTVTEPAIIERTRQAVEQSIQIIEKRVNAMGLVEPSIQRQGLDRILVQVPGLGDPTQLINDVGRTQSSPFASSTSMMAEQALQSGAASGIEVLYGTQAEAKRPDLIEKRVIVSGEDLTDAQPDLTSSAAASRLSAPI